MKRIKLFLGLAGSLCLLATSAQAVLVLAPGASGPVPVRVGALPGAGSIVASLIDAPYADGALAGTVSSWVIANDTDNPFVVAGGAAELSFYYRIEATGDEVLRLALEGFRTFGVGVEYSLAAWVGDGLVGGVPPATATRGTSAAGNVVGFNFNPAVVEPAHSALLIVHTSSQVYRTNPGNVIDGGNADVTILSPVPEPTTVIAGALLLLPFALSTVRRLRKNRIA